MAAVTIGQRQWDVDGGGVACLVEPGIPTAVTTQMPSAQMDRAIARLGERKTRLTAQVAACQAELDAVTQQETDMIALRATVTAEPA